MQEICSLCEGSGLRILEENGRRFARPCECRAEQRAARMLERARIPKRFRDCSFDSYEVLHSTSNSSLVKALTTAKHFANGYPLETDGKGILLTGSKGLGKTHIAISLLKQLVVERGASGAFWEHKELMESLRAAMFGEGSSRREDQLLQSVTRCDVLVLDDLGDITPSDWSWDTTAYILNTRYNERLSTVVTTNLDNLGALSSSGGTSNPLQGRQRTTGVTLGDRIGDRMWSRLQEMCVVVEMHGEDFRQKVKRASFA